MVCTDAVGVARKLATCSNPTDLAERNVELIRIAHDFMTDDREIFHIDFADCLTGSAKCTGAETGSLPSLSRGTGKADKLHYTRVYRHASTLAGHTSKSPSLIIKH